MEGLEPNRKTADDATVEGLRRLADMLSAGVPLVLRLNGRRVRLPDDASPRLALRRDRRNGCVEVDVRWSHPQTSIENGERSGRGAGSPRHSQMQPGPHIRLKALIAEPRQ